jgi:hypothetical protein
VRADHPGRDDARWRHSLLVRLDAAGQPVLVPALPAAALPVALPAGALPAGALPAAAHPQEVA